MATQLFDADALISMFETASARQGAQLRKATGDATLAALRGRELTLKNIRTVLQQVAQAASAGAAKNLTTGIDPGDLLDKAVAGMDDALLKAVEANRVALQTLASQGASLQDTHMTKALGDLEKLEDTFFAALKKASAGATEGPLAHAWGQVMQKMQAGGSMSGSQATQASEQLAQQVQTALRDTRAASIRAAQALAESYTALVSGILVGMSEALQSGGAQQGDEGGAPRRAAKTAK